MVGRARKAAAKNKAASGRRYFSFVARCILGIQWLVEHSLNLIDQVGGSVRAGPKAPGPGCRIEFEKGFGVATATIPFDALASLNGLVPGI